MIPYPPYKKTGAKLRLIVVRVAGNPRPDGVLGTFLDDEDVQIVYGLKLAFGEVEAIPIEVEA